MSKINSIRKAIRATADGLSKFNETIHGSAAEAAKTVTNVKSSVNAGMFAKGAYDCVVSYQCNDMVCLTISAIGTTADLGSFVCGNVPFLKKATPVTSFISTGCKSFVHLCRTGNITFLCNEAKP